jgi:hypothetical protein
MPRLILAVATETDADTKFIWNQIRTIQEGMFAVGPLQMKFAYFGAEGSGTVRPFISTDWITNAGAMRRMLDEASARCCCGCYVNVSDILAHALQETKRGPVEAVIITADYFRGPGQLSTALGLAERLRSAGSRLFLFQSKTHERSEEFRALAEATGGALIAYNPAIELIAERVPETMTALAHFAVGGLEMLRKQDNESAARLLAQMSAVPGIRGR